MKMAEAALLPAVRAADADTLIVADGTSCRHQIADGAQREAIHVARVLEAALPQGADARRLGVGRTLRHARLGVSTVTGAPPAWPSPDLP